MIKKIQKDVIVEMERNEKITKIVFDNDDTFSIYWADGTITHYGYQYHSSQGGLREKSV